MEDSTNSKEYKGIFKSTFLFGFVQVFNISVKVITNKIVAVLLGAEGIGLIGIYHSTISLLKTGAGLGISQSAVRDISEANAAKGKERFSLIISVTKKVILLTALLGCVVTIGLSPWLSEWTLGNRSYVLAFACLSVVVGINILTEGQLAILKGMRQLQALAKASMIGAVAGLISAIPMYFFFGKQGIIPSLFLTALSALCFSNYFVKKIKYNKQNFSFRVACYEAKPMVQMGIALMFTSFIMSLSDLIVASYITKNGGLDILGHYNAGNTIISGYFGLIVTAMTTDYYPRISAVHYDNKKLEEEVNRQSKVGLILVFPLGILFLFLSPVFINALYSNEFEASIVFTDFAFLGVIIAICSNCMGMILLAKQKSSIFIWTTLLHRILLTCIYIYLYKLYGLFGLGIGYIITVIINFALMSFIMRRFYKISFSANLIKHLLIVLFFALLVLGVKHIDHLWLKYFIGSSLFVISCAYSILIMKLEMNINIFNIMKNRINKK